MRKLLVAILIISQCPLLVWAGNGPDELRRSTPEAARALEIAARDRGSQPGVYDLNYLSLEPLFHQVFPGMLDSLRYLRQRVNDGDLNSPEEARNSLMIQYIDILSAINSHPADVIAKQLQERTVGIRHHSIDLKEFYAHFIRALGMYVAWHWERESNETPIGYGPGRESVPSLPPGTLDNAKARPTLTRVNLEDLYDLAYLVAGRLALEMHPGEGLNFFEAKVKKDANKRIFGSVVAAVFASLIAGIVDLPIAPEIAVGAVGFELVYGLAVKLRADVSVRDYEGQFFEVERNRGAEVVNAVRQFLAPLRRRLGAQKFDELVGNLINLKHESAKERFCSALLTSAQLQVRVPREYAEPLELLESSGSGSESELPQGTRQSSDPLARKAIIP